MVTDSNTAVIDNLRSLTATNSHFYNELMMGRPQNLQRTRHERATFPHPTVSKAAPFTHFPPLATRHPVETASDPIGQPWEINAGTG